MTKDEWIAAQQAQACEHFRHLIPALAEYAEATASHMGGVILDWTGMKVAITIESDKLYDRKLLN